MPSGSGVSSRSHSSVHADFSIRACLPVSDRERIVSADVAARNFSFTTGCVSASSVVSHTDPHHTPCAPSAIAAAICRPRPMPPAPSTGMSTASTISGISTIEPISPVCPPASEPWAMIRSTPAAWWRSACCGRPASAPISRPSSFTRSMRNCGGGPSALATNAVLWASAISSCGPAELALNGALPSWPEIDVPARVSSSAGSSGTS